MSLLLAGLTAAAGEGDLAAAATADSTPGPFRDEPATIEAPRMRNVEPRTCVYLDGTAAASGDLSALPNIAGQAHGARIGLGGSLKLSRFQLDLELPALQMTRLDLVDPNPVFMIDPQDRRQTSYALGDSRLGAQWTARLPTEALAAVVGVGMGVRVPTHTGRFTFHFVDGTEGIYVLPYYFHLEPTLLFGEALGPVTFVMNQGALILLGPDGEVSGIPVVTPTIYFWDAHYAVSVRLGGHLALSFAANTSVQLNQIDPVMFPNLNHVRSLFLVPGAEVRLGPYRIDLIARLGVTRGAEPLGVITYAGTDSLTLRVTRELD